VNVPSTSVVAKSPTVTSMAADRGRNRNRAIIAGESSIRAPGCPGELGEEAHRGLDDVWIEEVRPQDLVPLSDQGAEVVLGHAATLVGRGATPNGGFGGEDFNAGPMSLRTEWRHSCQAPRGHDTTPRRTS
jgi:hypothetical protein